MSILASEPKIWDHTIDGSLLEGGGQVLRNGFAYAALLDKSCDFEKIRGGRREPGLRPQHLTGINLIADLVSATTKGVEVKSNNVTFIPNKEQKWKEDHRSELVADIKTAGSITLLLQACLPVVLFRGVPTKLTLKGGTDVYFSPPINYITEVLLPTLSIHCGISVKLDVEKRGFAPQGGGIVNIQVDPMKKYLLPINLTEQGIIDRIVVNIYVQNKTQDNSSWEKQIAESLREQYTTSINELCKKNNYKCKFEIIENIDSNNAYRGSSVLVTLHTTTGCLLASSVIGQHKQLKKQKKQVELEAASDITPVDKLQTKSMVDNTLESLFADYKIGACVDEHLQDQLIIYCALAKGVSKLRTCSLSLHTETAIYYAKLFTGVKIKTVKDGDTWIIECEGVGYK